MKTPAIVVGLLAAIGCLYFGSYLWWRRGAYVTAEKFWGFDRRALTAMHYDTQVWYALLTEDDRTRFWFRFYSPLIAFETKHNKLYVVYL